MIASAVLGLVRVARSRSAFRAATLATGTAMAQVIVVGSAPFLTRMYGPSAFGLYAVISSITIVLAVLGALGLPAAMIVAPNDSDSDALGLVALWAAAVVGALCLVSVAVSDEWLARQLHIGMDPELLYLVGPLVFLTVGVQVGRSSFSRRGLFTPLAALTAVTAAVTVAGQLLGGAIRSSDTTFALASGFGIAFSAAALLALRRGRWPSPGVPHRRSLVELVAPHKRFMYFRMPQELLVTVSQNLPQLLLGSLFAPNSAGYYVLAQRALQAPSSLIAGAVGDVFYPRVTLGARRGEPVFKLMMQATGILILIGLVPFGCVIALGPQLFDFAFGSRWILAGRCAQWLAVWLFCSFINAPSVRAIPVLGLQGAHLLIEVVSTAARISSLPLVAALRPGHLLLGVAIFSCVSGLHSLLLVGYVMASARRRA